MAMSDTRYIAQQPDGAWVVVYDGNVSYYDDYNQAAQVYQQLDAANAPAVQPAPAYRPPTPSPAPNIGGGQQIVGGMDQFNAVIPQLQQEYLRQRLKELEIPGLDIQRRAQILQELQGKASLSGYMDNDLWQKMLGAAGGTTGGTPTGNYDTKNGSKTLDQMRQELVQASGGMQQWRDAKDDQVISEYAKVTGGPVNPVIQPPADTGGTGGTPGTGTTDQRTLARWQAEEQLKEQQRQFDLSRQRQNEQFYANMLSSLSGPKDWMKYQIAQSNLPADAQTNDLMQVFGATPAFGGMKATPSWEQAWANFRPGGAEPIEMPAPGQKPLNLPPQTGGALQPPSVIGGAPGALGTLEQPTYTAPANPALDKSYASGGPTEVIGGQPMGKGTTQQSNTPWYGQFTQPIQIKPSDYSKMTSSQKQMLEGQWSASGVDPNAAWSYMQRAWPKGQTNTRTFWR